MNIERDRKSDNIFLTQNGYLKMVLQKFNINGDTKPVSTPLASHFKLKVSMSPATVEEHKYISHVPDASAVGSLLYAMGCMRPDLSQAVSLISTYMHDPGRGYWDAVKQILWYIKSRIDIGLVFKKDTTSK